MKIADILQQLQFATARKSEPESFVGDIENRPDVEVVDAETEDNTATDTMVAPLQQKLELLKKAVDVDNFYGKSESQSVNQPINITLNIPAGSSDSTINLTVNGETVDELDQIRRIAGVPVATIFDAGDDEPLDS